MRLPIWFTIVAALVGMAVILVIGQQLIQPELPLIVDVEFSLDVITPNADLDSDITVISYELSENAYVTLLFEAEDGTIYNFRDRQRRIGGEYSVNFSGVVDGYMLPDEDIAGTIERRLMPDGQYTWRLIAESTITDEVQEESGQFTIQDADVPLPLISQFETSVDLFTPNQDGIDDRVLVSMYLEKGANLSVYLEGNEGTQYPISARLEGRLPGEPGRHTYDYEGGIDLGADPPPDGVYTIVALAQDDEGQRIRRETQLEIRNGGKPRAEIKPQPVGADIALEVHSYDDRYFSTKGQMGDLIAVPDDPDGLVFKPITMVVGDMLVFRLTVENYSTVPIRTTGPMPGTVYQQEQLAATLGFADESGAWRIGIECQTSTTSYPWRWAIGSEDLLVEEVNPHDGRVYKYLPPGAQSVVWGAVRMTEIEDRNPQFCWAGLIHEDVEISLGNNNVGRREITLIDPDGSEN